jgi:hypothetical protein
MNMRIRIIDVNGKQYKVVGNLTGREYDTPDQVGGEQHRAGWGLYICRAGEWGAEDAEYIFVPHDAAMQPFNSTYVMTSAQVEVVS